MQRRDTIEVKPWLLFVLVLAIVVPISAGFVLGGPTVGLLAGLAVAVVIVVVAIREKPGRG